MRLPCGPLRLLFCLLLIPGTRVAIAGQVTELTSAFDEDNPYDFHMSVGYQRTLKRGAIKRELAGSYADGIHMVKDLRFSQIRHILSIRAEAAIYKDLQLHVEFPIVLSDSRWLDFAQNDGDSCGTPPTKHCVFAANSTLVRDRFLPNSIVQSMASNQVEVAGPERRGNLFYLPRRSGLDQFHLGLSWAPMSQKRTPSMPTWVIGFEARIGVGTAMQHNPYFDTDPAREDDPTNPRGNTTVGRGIHQYHWWTTVSKRYPYIDPWVTFFYMLPDAKDDSLYEKTHFPLSGQERSGPTQRGGVEGGIEIFTWEDTAENHSFTIELMARLEGVFEGRDYSEMWEIFANNPMLRGPCRPSPTSNLPEKWDNGTYCSSPDSFIPYPGLTSIENHAVFAGSLAFNLELTKYIRGRLGISLGHEQQHFITFGDAGKDLPGQHGISYQNEQEVNPLFRPYIDVVGRRFRVADTTVFDFFVSLEGRL